MRHNEVKMRIQNKYSDDFKREYTTGAFIIFNRNDFRINFFNDEVTYPKTPEETPTVNRIIHTEIILTPYTMRLMGKSFSDKIDEIEKGS